MDNFIETYKTAIGSLSANKARSFLTMLGVIIGVFAVVSLVSLGRGLQNYITDQFDALGSNLIFVSPGSAGFGNDPALSFTRNRLNEVHVQLIQDHSSEFISVVSPTIRSGQTVTNRNRTFFATITGVNEQGLEIFNYDVAEGRSFNRSEVRSASRVAVIGPLVAQDLFPNQNPIGQRFRLESQSYEIIGTTQEKGADFDDLVVIPYTAAMNTLDLSNFSSIALKAKDLDRVDLTIRSVELALLRDLGEDDFSIFSQDDVLASIQSILGVLTIALGAIAGISLLVGGIGIMNIMLVSVTERTKEIGLRKAVGATPANIALQFLLESVTLSVIGGLIGLGLGYISTFFAQSFVRAEIPLWGVLVAFGFSVGIGVLFGTYPAIKASKKDPIEALRYE